MFFFYRIFYYIYINMSKQKISEQVIIMRTDLRNSKNEKIRTGKLIAQGAHASMKAVLDLMVDLPSEKETTLYYGEYKALEDWLKGRFTKVCLSVDSEKEMLELYQKAKEKGLICSLITDAGLTEFGGVPTRTCIAIGPNWSDEIDEITGHLKLL